MENDAKRPADADSSLSGRLLRLAGNVLIGAALTYGLNFFLERTGWDSWARFSSQADHFAENLMTGSARLSPFTLWKSIVGSGTAENNPAYYLPENMHSENAGLVEKLRTWLNYYWYKSSGKPFWVGRILLVLSAIAGFSIAVQDHRDARNKSMATIAFPLNLAWKTVLVLLVVGMLCLLLYFFIKFFLAIGGALAFLVSAVYAGGGFLKILSDEIRGEVAGSAKKTVTAWLLPFLFKRNKPVN